MSVRKRITRALFILLLMGGGGCSTAERIGITLLYREAEFPPEQVKKDLPYVAEAGPKQRLDLFLPKGTGWPTLVFIHGGGWNDGDKNLRVGGADVYGNIGRFYASRGIGVAVINYRLLPEVTWQEQLTDVAQAVHWIQSRIGDVGGDPALLFLSGHSAGAQLAARLALDQDLLREAGIPRSSIRGVIVVSGAAFDLADDETYRLGQERDYYASRFGTVEGWAEAASPISYVSPAAPEFLILYGGVEEKSLQRQSHLLNEALRQEGIASRIVVVPRQSHARIVLTLSRDDKTAAPTILSFIRSAAAAE